MAGDGVPAATAPLCHNIADLVAQRERWREGCALLRDDAALWERCRAAGPTLARGVQDCVAVLLGDGAALEAATDNWLEMMAAMLQHVYMPSLAHRTADWGARLPEESSQEFLGSVGKFVEMLGEAVSSLESGLELAKP